MDIEQAKTLLGKRFAFMANDANQTIQDLDLPKNSRILDVGTGNGYFAILLGLNGYKILTGEPDSDQSEYAKKNWLEHARQVGVENLIKFKAFEAQDMLFDDHMFDAVFFFAAFHHVEEAHRNRVMQEALRVSKPKGIICFIEPNQEGMKVIMANDPAHPDAADPGRHINGIEADLQTKAGAFFDSFILQKKNG